MHHPEKVAKDTIPSKVKDFIRSAVEEQFKSLRPDLIKHFDAVIIYDKRDYEHVVRVKYELTEIMRWDGRDSDIRIELFDNEAYFSQSRISIIQDVINKCCLLLFYLTENADNPYFHFLCEEAIAFSKLYTETGAAVHPKSECVIKPIHTLPQSARHYKAPPGLASLTSIDWFDRGSKFTRDKIISVLINAKVTREQNEATDKTRREFAFMHYASRVMPGTSQSVHPDKGSPKY
ncbi:uncharacterized protein LOC127879988 isoform X1 [Dreissena polymorpha]|uniref:TIR domain-containing protein n=1 Tax=Dreissena polymorpha TaxID=45954 RepID=A0A9D4K961_DREPO|nr:uncharacterized protein LOC127879988 isoform X1 [Dreissena polymorpha]XP_052283110.1 uncharacterized protein LOC127879988 isoform X1 [Dreissena polymorpha]XP_052283111.1 uncharacterized protein LOC127879988 isoform X1 [Dreissena polymorpha]KAH3835463.1 hypothetical protein DPMN_108811 [Dreissena polymorpha]